MDSDSAALSPTQRRVLVALKRSGDATADELAATLEISSSAIRQHLSALRSASFVAALPDRGQTGRPADRYRATDLTESLFVAPDGNLAADLLEHIEEEDPEMVARIFERRRHRLVDDARDGLSGKPIGEQVVVLTALLDAQGYLADSEQVDSDHYRINLHSCAIWTVASRYSQACTAELDLIRDLIPDAAVERVTHKTAGAHTCAYEITLQTQ